MPRLSIVSLYALFLILGFACGWSKEEEDAPVAPAKH